MALPDLSRLEESVQAQLRERYAALAAKQKDPETPTADLGTEYGEMGKLLMAAEFHDPAEASFLNAEALAPGDMRWPYYLGHLYRTKGDIPNAMAAFERALRLAPTDVPTMIWLGESALDQGRPDVAEPLFTKALSLQPRSAAAHTMASDARRWPTRITFEPRRISNRRWRSTARRRSSTTRWRWHTVVWATLAARNCTCSNAARCRSSPTR